MPIVSVSAAMVRAANAVRVASFGCKTLKSWSPVLVPDEVPLWMPENPVTVSALPLSAPTKVVAVKAFVLAL